MKKIKEKQENGENEIKKSEKGRRIKRKRKE
jgi:hypothetical protein